MIKVGLDIGNSKISCVVCDFKSNHKPRILAFVNLPTTNLNKNANTNVYTLKKDISEIIEIASKESQTEIQTINLNVPISGSNSYYYNSEINIENEIINELHLKKAINQSEFFDELKDYKNILNYIVDYEIDNKLIKVNPIGNFAKKLNVRFYKLSINQNIINTYQNLFDELKIHVANFIPTPVSSALATLNDDDQELGAICIDLGESSTSIAVFENKKLIFCDSISIGSKNITNDLARGISTTKESAERLKNLYGSVISSPSDEYEIIEVPIISSEENQFRQINRSTINLIIKPRVEETLEMIWQKLKQYGLNKKGIKNLILTGGGSQLDGVEEYAKIIFDSNVRLGKPLGLDGLNKVFSGPQFSQTIGTVFYQESQYEVNFLKKSKNLSKNSVFGRFSSWLDRYI